MKQRAITNQLFDNQSLYIIDGYYSKTKFITNLTTQRSDIDIDNLWLGCGPCMKPNRTQWLNVSIQLALVGPFLTGYGAQVTHM